MDIGSLQLNSVRELKKFSNRLKEKKINTGSSAYTFIATWGDNLGFEFLKYKILKFSNILNFVKILFKDFYFAFTTDSIEIINKFEINKKNKIIFSNASLTDFRSDGSYTDRYFKINSKFYNEYIFIIIYTDKDIPNQIDSNLILLRRKKTFFLKNFFLFIIKSLDFILLKRQFSFFNYSGASKFGEKLIFSLENNIDFKSITKIFFPYEGITFQQQLCLFSKNINPKINIIGYDHSAPHANPLNLLYREGSPDLLFVNGKSQKNYLINYLDWPSEKIKIVPSLRYKNNSKEKFENTIFFPWKISNSKIVIDSLTNLLENIKTNSLGNLKVKIHPVCADMKKQLRLKKEIEILLAKHESKLNNVNNKTSIFIGSTTSVIVALEKNLNVYHICFDPIFDSYSDKMWPELKVEKITNNTFKYFLSKKNNFINFGKDEKIFDKYYNVDL